MKIRFGGLEFDTGSGEAQKTAALDERLSLPFKEPPNCMAAPIISLALRKLRQENAKFKANLDCII